MTAPLDSRDIPQSSLVKIRAVVDAVASGRSSVVGVARRAKMKGRAALYHLAAASRTMGLLMEDRGRHALTPLGRDLESTEAGSEEERSVFARAVRSSAVLSAWAGDLLAERAPSEAKLIERAVRAGLSERTARQRARSTLKWRKQLLAPPLLPYGTRSPDSTIGTVREEVAPAFLPQAARVRMLRAIELHDFKSFAEQRIPLAPLTVLVGANASGKSNALDAIRFLQGLALELSITDILRGRYEGGRLVWPAIRGGIQEVCRYGTERFGIGTEWSLAGQNLTHHITCTVDPAPLVTEEKLVGAGAGLGQYLFDTHASTLGGGAGLQDGRAINVAVRGTGGGRNPTQVHSAGASLLGQITPHPRMNDQVNEWSSKLQAAMRAATFLSISPAAMRDYAPRQALELAADGENVSAVVWQLCQKPDGKRRLVDWLSELCAPTITNIEFVETELGDVMLQLVEADGTKISARSLSDGTLRFLGEIVALLEAEPGSVLLIEEIENGLHPQRLHLLVELLETVTRERGIQVLVTSHSPLVLLALSEAALAQAVVFARVDGQPGTIARPLGELPHFDEVRKKRSVDRLFASGWLESAL